MARVTPIPFAGAERTRPYHRGAALRLAAAVLDWLERARQRRALQRLDDRLLSDIGLSRADVEGEAEKPFWRL